MAERYNIQYDDVIGNGFEISIYNSTYAGASTSLNGSAIYGMNALDSMTDPVRSKYLKLNLLANETNTLSDLITAEEREWSVTLERNSQLIFFGYLTSEGVTQSYVTAERFISFDVLDPIAFLEDLAYTDNSGTPYTGTDQLAQIIAKCLQRGFEPTPTSAWFTQIKAYVPYDYRTHEIDTGNTPSYTAGDFLKNIVLDQDQYIDQDGEIKSCLEVLKEILSAFSLFIMQHEGSWVIANYLYTASSMDSKYISYYDEDGGTITSFSITPFNTIEIVTDSVANQGQFIHCNENQSYFYKRGLQKLLVEHQYRFRESILENSTFDGGVTGVSMDGWTSGTGYYWYPVDDGTVRIYTNNVGGSPPDSENLQALISASNPPIGVGSGNQYNLTLKVVGSFMPIGFDNPLV
ncbi:MAG TPA: hypothetical protein VMW91_10825, partial [Desulfosporosinus sp.]|nr:hypothetical protein [Desulfosporosinus sp.]